MNRFCIIVFFVAFLLSSCNGNKAKACPESCTCGCKGYGYGSVVDSPEWDGIFTILLDNGHNLNDRRGGLKKKEKVMSADSTKILKARRDYAEGVNTRRLVALMKPLFEEAGYRVVLVAPEDSVPEEPLNYKLMDKRDIPHLYLADSVGWFNNTRINRINEYCHRYGANHCVVFSVHTNSSHLHNHRGWMVTYGKDPHKMTAGNYELATFLGKAFDRYKLKKNGRWRYEQDLRVTDYTNCPAVISECYYHDNIYDMMYLEDHLDDIVKANVEGVIDYIKSKGY